MRSRMTRRSFLQFTGAGLAASALAACGATATPQPAQQEVVTAEVTPVVQETLSPAATPMPPSATATTAAAAPTAASAERLKVRLGDPGQPGTQYFFEEVYDQAFPEYEIIREYAPWAEYHDKLLAQIAAATAPDLTFIGYGFFRQAAGKGVFIEIQPFIDSDTEFDAEGFTVPISVGGALKGKTYALQQCLSDPPGLVINTDAFEEAGIPLPPVVGEEGHDAAKWSDLLEWAEKLVKKDSSGNIERYGISSPYTNLSYCAMYWLQNGGDAFDNREQVDPTEFIIDSKECAEAFQFMVDLTNKYHVAPTSTESEALGTGDQQWYSGKVAMFHRWWHYGSANTDAFKWRGMHIPYNTKNANYSLYSNCWTIPSTSTQKDAAWKIMAGCTTWDIFLKQQIRTNRPAYKTEYWISQMPEAQQAYEKEMFSRYNPDDLSNQSPLFSPNRGPKEIGAALVSEIEAMYLGAKTVEQALADAAVKGNEILTEVINAE